VFVVPTTFAFSAVDWPPVKKVEDGLRVTDTVAELTVALALVRLAALVAVTVRCCGGFRFAGTAWTPYEVMLPAPTDDPVTDLFVVPVTVAARGVD
jgi:hypothetical protein